MKLINFLKLSLKQLRYLLEAVIVKLAIWFFLALPVQTASNLGAVITRFIGRRVAVNKLAYKNISNALPYLSEDEKERIIDDMWDNLGRIVGEFPHIFSYSGKSMRNFTSFSDETIENIKEIKALNKGGIIFSAHTGNWEVGLRCFVDNDLKTRTVYRPLNNPFVEEMTIKLRKKSTMIEKGPKGNRKIIDAIKSGEYVVIMADQKITDGKPVKFFHDDAITTTSIARLALKYDIPLIPVRVVRIGKEFKFRMDIEKPLSISRSDNSNVDILKLTREINLKLEDWIKEYPEQWFWVHNRWKK